MAFQVQCSALMLMAILLYLSGSSWAAPVDATFAKYNVNVDWGFSASQRQFIANAINKIPECYGKYLKGTKIRNNTGLRWSDGRDCLPGRQVSTLPPVIELNSACHVNQDLVLHEIFHVVGHRRLLAKYKTIFQTFPGCPVSAYSRWYRGRNMSEDFAEAARIIRTGGTEKSDEGCVTAKLKALKFEMDHCN